MTPEAIHPDTWPPVFALLEPAMKRCGYVPADLVDDLLDHSCQLWVDRVDGKPVGAGVTELRHSAEGLVMGVLLYGGTLSRLRATLEYAHKQAWHIGAIGIEMQGRKGWQRLLAREGYRPAGSAMRLDVGAQ